MFLFSDLRDRTINLAVRTVASGLLPVKWSKLQGSPDDVPPDVTKVDFTLATSDFSSPSRLVNQLPLFLFQRKACEKTNAYALSYVYVYIYKNF